MGNLSVFQRSGLKSLGGVDYKIRCHIFQDCQPIWLHHTITLVCTYATRPQIASKQGVANFI